MQLGFRTDPFYTPGRIPPRELRVRDKKMRSTFIMCPLWSGRRDSNPRPSAWKANALSTELLPQVGGQRWIRTTEGVSQQIYSLPHLATLVFAHCLQRDWKEFLSQLRCKGTTIFLTCKYSRAFLLQLPHIHRLYCPNAPLHAPRPAAWCWS